MKLEFFDRFSQNIQISNFIKNGSRVIPGGWMDRETDMTKLRVTFCNVANIHKHKS